MKLHTKPIYMVQIIENALQMTYVKNPVLWNKIFDLYERRYLNLNSYYKNSWKKYGYLARSSIEKDEWDIIRL